jgi:hypothetical protein
MKDKAAADGLRYPSFWHLPPHLSRHHFLGLGEVQRVGLIAMHDTAEVDTIVVGVIAALCSSICLLRC